MNAGKTTQRMTGIGVLILSVCGAAFATDPVVSAVTTNVRSGGGMTLVDVTFAFSDAENDACHIAMFGHDTTTLAYYPMVYFSQGDIYARTWTPGTHTVTWVATADCEAGSPAINTSTFKVYVQVSDTRRIAPGRFLVIDVSGGTGAPSCRGIISGTSSTHRKASGNGTCSVSG